jgi:hypothetical protein
MSYLSFDRLATVKLIALLLLVTQVGSIARAAEELEVVSAADKRLKQIQTDFDSVDIDDKDYTEKRYVIFKKLVNETIRLKAMEPETALSYVRAVTRTEAYAKRFRKENPDLYDTNAGASPTGPSPAVKLKPSTPKPKRAEPDPDAPATTNAPTTVVPSTPAKEPAKPARVIPELLKSYVRGMHNFLQYKDVTHAKTYAKKIIDEYPNTPEVEEAKTVMKMKE